MTTPACGADALSPPREGAQLTPPGDRSPSAGAHGRGHCGQVRFEVDFPSRFVAHCHLESCRRAHGDDAVDRAPSRHAFYEEHVGWLPALADPPA